MGLREKGDWLGGGGGIEAEAETEAETEAEKGGGMFAMLVAPGDGETW